MAALEVIALNKTVPQLMAPQVGDTYYMPRDVAVLTTAANANGSAILSGNTISETVSGSQWLVASQFDVGTAPNQIPLNQYLGTMAWQDAAAVNVGLLVTSGNAGVGVTPSAWGASSRVLQVGSSGSLWSNASGIAPVYLGNNYYFDGTDRRYLINGFAAEYQINAGQHRWFSTLVSGTAGNTFGFSEVMRLDAAGNLGLGVTPNAGWANSRAIDINNASISAYSFNNPWTLDLAVSAYATGLNTWFYKSSSQPVTLYRQANGVHSWSNAPSGTAGTAITFTQAMTLDAAGNLGLGVTPSAWNSSYKALQFPSAFVAQTGGFIVVGNNFYQDASNVQRYLTSSAASYYAQVLGAHQWHTAVSGTAGTAITFTQAMTLDASGNLGVGTSTFGTSAVKVLSIGTGTEPSTGPADTVQFFSVDRSAGNTIPGIRCEGTGVTDAGITNTTVTNKIAIKVNGTIYYLLATTNAT